MKRLDEIPQFPAEVRLTLAGRFGISSAEYFYDQALQNPAGLAQATGLPVAEVERLKLLVAAHLPGDYVERANAPLVRRARGLLR